MSAPGRRAGRRARAAIVAALVLPLALGCRRARPAPAPAPQETMSSVAAREWASTRQELYELMRRGGHARAESLVVAFRERFPGTPAAADALFWRGMLRADPAARGAQASREAAADLLAYERGGELHVHGPEAALVRRLLAQVDSLRAAVAVERTAASVLIPRDSLRPRDDEVLRLRAELEQAKAELDRVRRRLAPPPLRP